MGAFAEFMQPVSVFKRINLVKYPRRKPREMVARQTSEASSGTPSQFTRQALDNLRTAAGFLDAPAANDDARLKSIQNAEGPYDTAVDLIQQDRTAKTSVPKRPDPVAPTTKLPQHDETKREELTNAIGHLEETILGLNSGGGGKGLSILPPKKEYENTTMLGRAQSIRTHIANALDRNALDGCEKEIELLRKTAEDFENYILDARGKVQALEVKLGAGHRALNLLNDVEGVTPETLGGCKLVQLMEQANGRITAGVINASGLDKMTEELENEIKTAQSDPAGYFERVKQETKDKGELAAARLKFDTALREPLSAVRDVATATGDDEFRKLADSADEFRSELATFIGTSADQLDGRIKQFGVALAQALEKARSLQTKNAEEARKKLGKIETESRQAMALFQKNPAYAADLRMIEGTKGMIAELLDNQDGGIGARLSTLAAADRLIESLREQIAEAGKAGGATTLPDNMPNLQKSLDNATELALYNADGLEELKQKLGAFRKSQPGMRAGEAVTAYAEISKSFRDKDAEAKQIAQLIATQADNYKSWSGAVAIAAGNRGITSEENCYDAVLSAYESAIAARPAVKTDIETTFKALQAAFTKPPAKEGEQPTPLSGDAIVQRLEQEQAGLAGALKKSRAELGQRLKVLKERLGVAEKLVKEKDGDENPAKAVQRLLDDANDQLGGKKPDAAKPLLDRAEQRIYVILANPAGGLARKRTEIPALLREWQGARAFAHKALQGLFSEILSYKPQDEEKWEATTKLAHVVQEYADAFGGGADPLQKPLDVLASTDASDAIRRKAREDAVAAIDGITRSLQAHPFTRELAAAPFPEARAAPLRLVEKLDAMRYIVLTSVE